MNRYQNIKLTLTLVKGFWVSSYDSSDIKFSDMRSIWKSEMKKIGKIGQTKFAVTVITVKCDGQRESAGKSISLLFIFEEHTEIRNDHRTKAL